jgi:hypothetical protein
MLLVLELVFELTCHSQHLPLPPEAKTVAFQLVLPSCWFSHPSGSSSSWFGVTASKRAQETRAEMTHRRPVVGEFRSICIDTLSSTTYAVLLAGTGEHGFTRRRHYVSYPLARVSFGLLA